MLYFLLIIRRKLKYHDKYLDNPIFTIRPVKILEVREVGSGERVCVDTASMLTTGEGMLVGSRSNFMFLIHNESEGSAFTSPRPFRSERRRDLLLHNNPRWEDQISLGDRIWHGGPHSE